METLQTFKLLYVNTKNIHLSGVNQPAGKSDNNLYWKTIT